MVLPDNVQRETYLQDTRYEIALMKWSFILDLFLTFVLLAKISHFKWVSQRIKNNN
jgi:hypothetical protein